jgi:hypothetical protein
MQLPELTVRQLGLVALALQSVNAGVIQTASRPAPTRATFTRNAIQPTGTSSSNVQPTRVPAMQDPNQRAAMLRLNATLAGRIELKENGNGGGDDTKAARVAARNETIVRDFDESNRPQPPVKPRVDLLAVFANNATQFRETRRSVVEMTSGGNRFVSNSDLDENERGLQRVFDVQVALNSSSAGGASDAVRRDRQQRLQEKTYKLMEDMQEGRYTQRTAETPSTNATDFQVWSGRRDGADKSRVGARFSTRGQPCARVRWQSRPDTTASSTEDYYEFGFALCFDRLAEINSGLTAVSSTKFLRFADYPSSWSTLRNVQITNTDGTTYRQISTSFVPGAAAGTQFANLNMTFSMNVASDIIALTDGSILKPNGLKYSLSVKGLQYTLPGGRYSLVQGLRTPSTINATYDATVGEVQIGGGAGAFNWDTSIVADGAVNSVNITSFAKNAMEASENNYRVVFQFPAGAQTIDWDPEAVVDESSVTDAAVQMQTDAAGGMGSTGSGPKTAVGPASAVAMFAAAAAAFLF